MRRSLASHLYTFQGLSQANILRKFGGGSPLSRDHALNCFSFHSVIFNTVLYVLLLYNRTSDPSHFALQNKQSQILFTSSITRPQYKTFYRISATQNKQNVYKQIQLQTHVPRTAIGNTYVLCIRVQLSLINPVPCLHLHLLNVQF